MSWKDRYTKEEWKEWNENPITRLFIETFLDNKHDYKCESERIGWMRSFYIFSNMLYEIQPEFKENSIKPYIPKNNKNTTKPYTPRCFIIDDPMTDKIEEI